MSLSSAELVGYLLLFLVVGVGFILIHLLVGKVVRPARPNPEKLTIYECGEPTIGSAWVQFDLRFYVVALLFVIFDVEVAFFFPWAVVFGQVNTVADGRTTPEQREQVLATLNPGSPGDPGLRERRINAARDIERLRAAREEAGDNPQLAKDLKLAENEQATLARDIRGSQDAARWFGLLAFGDILVFFGVLLVGFAYLWKQGDLDWVRSLVAERLARAGPVETGPGPRDEALAGAGNGTQRHEEVRGAPAPR